MSSAPQKLNQALISDEPTPKPPVAEPARSTSALESFLEAFLQEKNIRWMLGIGVLILLGSSLMFVTKNWNAMDTIWQYAVLLGYTGLVHACGQAAYHKLGLRKTGTALMAVTLLLIPMLFFSLQWLTAGTAAQNVGLAGLFAGAALFGAMASRRILRHFLRGDCPAVLISYLALTVLGGVGKVLPESLNMLWAFLAWALFAFGSVKANREVFWLTEEHRLPRIFGFFPIMMFGLQFLTIFALYFRDAFPSQDWFGLGCVLTALPVMLTADAFAKVYKQRTGDLVRPLPLSIIGPIVVGLTMCVIGLGLATTGLPTPYALVPTAALFAVMMALTARRTGQKGFVWAGLLGAVLAYQFSPVFFMDLVLKVRSAAATAVNETPEKLHYAYYGLTYMPFLLACCAGSFWRRGADDVFTRPLRHASLVGSVLLFVVSFTHPHANFLVAAAMTVFVLVQAVLFGRRDVAACGLVALVTAAVRFVPFAEHVSDGALVLPDGSSVMVVGLMAVVLQLFGKHIDRFLDRHTDADSELPTFLSSWHAAALPVTIIALGWWLWTVLPVYAASALGSGLLMFGLLVMQALISPRRGFGELAIGFALLLSARHLSVTRSMYFDTAALMYSAILFGLSVFAQLTRKRTDRFAMAFSRPAAHMSYLSILVLGICCLQSVLVASEVVVFNLRITLAGAIAVVWCCIEGRKHFAAMLLGFLSLLAIQCAPIFEVIGQNWIPVGWAITSLVALQRSRRHEDSTLETISLGLLAILALGSFVFFNLPMTIAGGLALVGFLMQSAVSHNRSLRGACLVLVNWQVIGMVFRWACPNVANIFDLHIPDVLQASLPMAAMTALSSLIFHHPRLRDMNGDDSAVGLREILELQFWALSFVTGIFLVLSLNHLPHRLEGVNLACSLIAFTALAASTFISACHRQSETGVWSTQGTILLGVIYLLVFEIVHVGHGFSMFAVLGAAFANSLLARAAGRTESMKFAIRPLQSVARVLPMGTVGIALVKYGQNPAAGWLGIKSLAVLMTAAYYFWCGIEEKHKGLMVLAAAIVNFALILLWRDLNFTDPQFFMIPIGVSVVGLVELLKREIPAGMRNPLRYAGALMILVSPVFHIATGSWLHLFSLLVCSTIVALVAIGLRIRPLLYTGTAFLIADLIAMVVRGTIDNPDLLWLVGLGAGAGVIALAAFFERKRDNVMSRMRLLSAELGTWD